MKSISTAIVLHILIFPTMSRQATKINITEAQRVALENYIDH